MWFFKKALNSKIHSIKKFKNDHHYFIKDTSWVTLNQMISVLLGILLSVIFARFTTKEVFGDYNFIISIISILSIVAIPGLNTSMLRSISRGMDGVYVKAVQLSFIWSLLGVPILFLIGGYYYFFGNPVMGSVLFITAIGFPFIYAPNNWIAFLQGKRKFNIFAKYSLLQTIIRTIAIILAIFLGKGSLIPIFLAYILTAAITNVLYFLKCKEFVENDEKDEDWKKSGYKLTFNDFVSLSYDHLDKIFIGIFLGPTELAIYSIAVSIVSAIRGSTVQIMKVTYPRIFAMEKRKLKQSLGKIIPYIIIISIIFLIITISLLPFVMNFLYSEKYADSIIYAQLYSITIPLAVIMAILNTSLIAINDENALLRFRILGIILILVLYLILIPLVGLTGAIIGSIIYYVVLEVLQYLYLRSK